MLDRSRKEGVLRKIVGDSNLPRMLVLVVTGTDYQWLLIGSLIAGDYERPHRMDKRLPEFQGSCILWIDKTAISQKGFLLFDHHHLKHQNLLQQSLWHKFWCY